MKHVLTFTTLFVTGALMAGACTASDDDNDPDTTASGGSGGGGGEGSGGTPSSGGTSAGGSGGGSGGSSGGSGGGSQAGGAAGGGGDEGMSGAAGMDGEGGMAGAPVECLGDEAVETTPDCDDLSYSGVECASFDPPEPFGMTYCKQYAAHATPEAFAEMFDCLDQIDEEDECGEAHDEAVRICRNGVATLTCANEAVLTRCENFGCLGEAAGEVPLETCDTFLSSLTPEGQDHVVACINEHTADEPGGTWGTPPEPPGDDEDSCADIFLQCLGGTLQPTE